MILPDVFYLFLLQVFLPVGFIGAMFSLLALDAMRG